ncbi:MAG: hypothetical protein V3W34_19165 [Phycisphaerae bacterium]
MGSIGITQDEPVAVRQQGSGIVLPFDCDTDGCLEIRRQQRRRHSLAGHIRHPAPYAAVRPLDNIVVIAADPISRVVNRRDFEFGTVRQVGRELRTRQNPRRVLLAIIDNIQSNLIRPKIAIHFAIFALNA